MNTPSTNLSFINSELERLFDMQTNDEKLGKIITFLRDEKVKKVIWSREEYYKLLRVITSCESLFGGRDGRINKNKIDDLIKSIPSIKALEIESTRLC